LPAEEGESAVGLPPRRIFDLIHRVSL